MSGEQFAQFFITVELARIQNLHCRHNESGGTETALDRGFLDKSLLDIAQFSIGRQETFQRLDVFSFCPDSKIDAGIKCFSVDQYIAGSALADFAALFHGSQVIVVAQHIRKRCAHIDHLFDFFAVDCAVNQFILCTHAISPPASSTARVNARLAISTAIC